MAEIGDYVEVKSRKGIFRGIIMPKHKFSSPEIVVLKLDNGYNIGIIPEEIKVIRKGMKKKGRKKEIKEKEGRKTISFIGTGGTIASYVDYRTGAVHPAMSAEDIVFSVPEIEEECNVRSTILFNILSEDMNVSRWVTLARKIKEEAKKADGIVIPHGTDTLHYTSSALSFMFPKLSLPVVLVGSQRSSDRPSSDSYLNLLSSVKVAKSDLGEVVVVMHASTSDEKCYIHRGTKVRKMHTSRRDAFKSLNSKPIGEVGNDVKFYGEYRKRDEETVLMDKMDERVSLIYYYPGLSIEKFESMLDGMHGAIIIGTGLGHISSKFLPAIRREIKDGKIIGMTSQCLYGRVNLNVYSTGRELKDAGVIPLEDMLPETAYIKLMWLLGNYDRENVIELLPKNLRGEISSRRMLV